MKGFYNPMNLVQTQNLYKTYEKEKLKIPALDNVSLSIRDGEFVSIIGKSGSGKSTLLNLIGGLDKATSGSIQVLGEDLLTLKSHQLAKHRKQTVGMVFQSFNLISSRNALENVELAYLFNNIPRKKRIKQAKALLEKLGLASRMYHKPSELSGGEAQRVAIARALANDPPLLLADEPTGNLDSKTTEDIMTLLYELNSSGKTIIMITHDGDSAKSVSHRMIELLDGRIIHEQKGDRS